MIRIRAIALLLAMSAFGTAATAAPVAYEIDPAHTDVIASWSHFGFSNPSLHMGGAKGTIWFDQDSPANSRVEVDLPLASLDSHVPALNEHLLGKDFFDASEYPTVSFRSHRVDDLGAGRLDIHGDLHFKGGKHPVVLRATTNAIGKHPMTGKPTIGFDATTTVSRSSLGMDGFVPAVSDAVRVRITTEASAGKAK